MKQLELNFAKVLRRQGGKEKLPERNPELGKSIIQEIEEYKQSRFDCFGNARTTPPVNSLLHMFNEDQVDFVSFKNGDYHPAISRNRATHQLIATSWNTDPTEAMPENSFALSVYAKPLAPVLKQTKIKISRPIPKNAPIYKLSSSLKAKRQVLHWLVKETRARLPKTRWVRGNSLSAISLKLSLRKLNDSECDLLYRNICRASKLKRLKRLLEALSDDIKRIQKKKRT